MLSAIQDLREIARRCVSGLPLSEELAQWLGQSLSEYLSHRAHSVDEAFGLRAARGGVPWWREEAMRQRDRLLRQLAARHFRDASTSKQARQIFVLALRYAASAWRFDRQLEEMPARYAGTVHEELWGAFKTGAPMPIGERHLRTILAQTRRHRSTRIETPAAAQRLAQIEH
jgi:hypothetical protein